MHCKKIKFCIERYIDKTLGEPLSAIVGDHLKTCSNCASAYDKAVKMRVLVNDDILPEIPANFTANVVAIVHRLEYDRKNRAGYLNDFRRFWAIASTPARTALGTAFLLFMIGGVFMTKDLIIKPDTLTYMNFTELDAFSASQKGSIEETYFQMTTGPLQGGGK
jgi:hypothetical protein